MGRVVPLGALSYRCFRIGVLDVYLIKYWLPAVISNIQRLQREVEPRGLGQDRIVLRVLS